MPDKWGYPFMYPTKKTGGLGTGQPFFWQQPNDIRDDPKILGMAERSGGGGIGDVNTSTGEFTAFYESSDSWTINKDPSFTSSIGGSDMDFTATEKRGYGYKADQPRDIELTIIAKWLDSSDDTGWSVSGPTGRHSTDPCCSGFAYMFSVEEPNSSPQKFRFRKEMYHVNYDDDPKTGKWTHSKFNFAVTDVNRYLGFKYIRYNKPNGRGTGKDSVVIEAWGNPNPDANKNDWTLLKRTEDVGGWGDGGDQCNGASSQVGTWSNAVFRVKASDMEIRFKHCSLREINPFGEFDPDPTDQDPDDNPNDNPVEVTGVMTLKYDINTYRVGQCSPAGSVEFYNSPRDPVDNTRSWTFGVESSAGVIRHRIGWICRDLGSLFVNQPPLLEADLWLWKQGSPTGTLTVRIRNQNNTIKATIGTLDVSTLTTSPVLTQFINLSNGYKMVVGDMLLAEYTGGDANNFVRMGKRDTLYSTGGVSTRAIYWNVYPSVDRYEEVSTREIVGKLLN